jgi:hypothetical protein
MGDLGVKARLHREGLVEELAIERFFGLVHHDNGHSGLVVLGSASPAHHLEDVGDGKIHVPPASGKLPSCGTTDSPLLSPKFFPIPIPLSEDAILERGIKQPAICRWCVMRKGGGD